ncbi:hypothetical protein [Pseudomonas sp. NA-150]|uniref:hypothetical protein n=1 Tax=Pseudomonas sp. NA-150 TaxID=3367525 RepID=UPI0037C6F186
MPKTNHPLDQQATIDKGTRSAATVPSDIGRITSYRAEIKARRRWLNVVFTGLLLLLGVLIQLNPSYVNWIKPFLPSYDLELVPLLGPMLITMALASVAMIYLQTGFKFSVNELDFYTSDSIGSAPPATSADSSLGNVTESMSEQQTSVFATGLHSSASRISGLSDYDQLVAAFLDQARKDPNEVVWADLLAQARKASIIATSEAAVLQGFEQARQRLLKEIESLGWRSNFNLILGMLVSGLGLTVLALYFFKDTSSADLVRAVVEQASPSEQNIEIKEAIIFTIAFLPRLSFVLLIELFAYFFLRLYKASLSEIKYFQNEITNIEAKSLALRIALAVDSPTSLNKAIGALVETERNHILEKGQSTVDLERAKIERQGVTDIAKGAAALVEKLKQKD